MHHYQKLCQLNATGKKQCDPYVWTEKDCHYERVFWKKNLKLKITTYLRVDFVCYLNPHGSFMLVERLLWITW